MKINAVYYYFSIILLAFISGILMFKDKHLDIGVSIFILCFLNYYGYLRKEIIRR